MENIGFIILRITILAFLIVMGSLLYNWINDNKSKVKAFFEGSFLLLTAAITFLIFALYWVWVMVMVWNG